MELQKLVSLFSQHGRVPHSLLKVKVILMDQNKLAKVSAMMGGISKASCSGHLPRNERQVMYFQKKNVSNPADELYEVMFDAKQEERVQVHPSD